MMHTAYYDASGTQSNRDVPLAVAGVLSTVDRWLRFERSWQRVLDKFRVPYFHAYEFAQGKEHFAPWKDDKPKRELFVKALVKVLKRDMKQGFVMQMNPADFDVVNARYALGEWYSDNAYAVLTQSVLGHMDRYVYAHCRRQPVRHVIEAGDDGQAILAAIARAMPFLRISIEPAYDPDSGKWFTPFQAADFIAYEHRVFRERALRGDARKPRGSFLAQRSELPIVAGVLNQQGMFQMCRENPDLYPRRVG